jgi:hypothetical protein
MTSFPRLTRGDFHCALYIIMMQNTSTRRFSYSAPRGAQQSWELDQQRQWEQRYDELQAYVAGSRYTNPIGSRYSAQSSRFGNRLTLR